MKTYEQLAKSGYQAACKKQYELDQAAGITSHRNMTWEMLDADARQALIAFTQQVVAEAALVH